MTAFRRVCATCGGSIVWNHGLVRYEHAEPTHDTGHPVASRLVPLEPADGQTHLDLGGA